MMCESIIWLVINEKKYTFTTLCVLCKTPHRFAEFDLANDYNVNSNTSNYALRSKSMSAAPVTMANTGISRSAHHQHLT